MKSFHLLALAGLVLMASPAFTQAPSLPQPGSVFLEELTWVEVRDAIAAGMTTVIIPTGGTEQNGDQQLGLDERRGAVVDHAVRRAVRRVATASVTPASSSPAAITFQTVS